MSEYQRVLDKSDFGWTADVSVTAGQWNKLGTFTCPAGLNVSVGRRFDGYAYAYMYTTAQVHGKIRIVATNPQETIKKTVLEFNTRSCGDATDKTKKPFVPLRLPWVSQDSKLILEYYPEANQSLVVASCVILIDATQRIAK